MKTIRLTTSIAAAILLVAALAPGAFAVKTCYDCHTDEKKLYNSRENIHKPTKDEDCESCHQRHGFAQTLILQDVTNDLCYKCHTDLKEEFAKDNVHFPVAESKCWDCHDPHASDKQALLRTGPEEADDPQACLMCHKADLEHSLNAEIAHPPFAELDCVRCHDPHASEHGGLLKATANELCTDCHNPGNDAMPTAHADKEISGLSCNDCHSGHSMDTPGLLSTKTHAPFADGDCEMCHSMPDAEGNVQLADGLEFSDLCAMCHDDILEKTELSHPHAAVMDDNCGDCHQPHSSRHGQLLLAAEGELCMECHTDLLTSSGKTPHLPAVLGQCSSCHEVHGSENAGLVIKNDASLCLECHEDFATARDSAETVHAATENCLGCHAPHEGLHAGILRNDPSQLCKDCHEVDDKALSAVSGHQPYMTSNCVGCHDPHHNDDPHLVRGEDSDICLQCHGDVGNRVNMPVAHFPATEDCRTCHMPHYSEENLHLLSSHQKDLCESCHDYEDLNITAEFVHTPASEGDCSGCHNPHGAVQEKLLSGRLYTVIVDGKEVNKVPRLTGKSADLCYTCHDDLVEKFRRQGVHKPVADGDCDACHAAHGSEHLGVVKAGAPELCADCHAINPTLEKLHGGYNLADADCVQCHNPHISDQPRLVRSIKHPPFEDGECDMCHGTGPAGEVELVAEASEMCTTCHETVSDGLDMPHQHGPFAIGECAECHGVHAADYPSLLRYSGSTLCYTCHTDLKEDTEMAVLHKPFSEGECLDCHEPHASQFTGLKTQSEETFCMTCHEDVKKEIEDGNPHAPVVDGECGACHEPHAGNKTALLTASKEDLCGTCHDLTATSMTAAHSGFAVAETNCRNCHASHAGVKGESGLLLPETHAPFAIGECGSCHENKSPTELDAPIKMLCLNCHSDFDQELTKPVVHAPVAEENGCTGCHGPHVGYGSALQKHDGVGTCLTCHDDDQFTGEFKHEPAFDDCATCHEVHSGEYKGLLNTPDIMEMCLTCHSDAPETHYHPMGDGVIDPRTKQELNCIGCHSPHSSDYAAILVADRDRKLCIVCHSLTH